MLLPVNRKAVGRSGMSVIDEKRQKKLNEFESIIGYSFKNISILNNALLTSSYVASKSIIKNT
jgi:dsRNA-specific ribonuclease